jgi:hypothetical protein
MAVALQTGAPQGRRAVRVPFGHGSHSDVRPAAQRHMYHTHDERTVARSPCARAWRSEPPCLVMAADDLDVLASALSSTPLRLRDCALERRVARCRYSAASGRRESGKSLCGSVGCGECPNPPEPRVCPISPCTAKYSGERAFRMAASALCIIDVLELYDSITITVLHHWKTSSSPEGVGGRVVRGNGGGWPEAKGHDHGGRGACPTPHGHFGILLLIEGCAAVRGRVRRRQAGGAEGAL